MFLACANDKTKGMVSSFQSNPERSEKAKELFNKIVAEMDRDYEGTKRVLNIIRRIDEDY